LDGKLAGSICSELEQQRIDGKPELRERCITLLESVSITHAALGPSLIRLREVLALLTCYLLQLLLLKPHCHAMLLVMNLKNAKYSMLTTIEFDFWGLKPLFTN
jgi:hypothetical protein